MQILMDTRAHLGAPIHLSTIGFIGFAALVIGIILAVIVSLRNRAFRLGEELRALRASEKKAREQAQALRRTLERLAVTPEPETFLQLVLEDLTTILGSDAVFLWSTQPRAEPGASLRQEQALPVDGVWPTPHPALVSSREVRILEGFVWVPLWFEDQLQGLLAARIQPESPPREPELFLAQALGSQATLALKLGEFATSQQENTILQERNSLSREIHDSLAQGFVMTGLQLERLQAELRSGTDVEDIRTMVDRALALNRLGLSEARRCIRLLRAEGPGEGALYDLLSGLEAQVRSFDLAFELRVEGPSLDPGPRVAFEIYRVAHEAVSNAIRHAEAGRIDLHLVYRHRHISLSIEDDGVGIQDEILGGAGLGFSSIDERATLIGARVRLRRRTEGGTRVDIDWPSESESGLQGYEADGVLRTGSPDKGTGVKL